MKTITLQIEYLNFIHATDSDGQWMNVTRLNFGKKNISDTDTCSVISGRNDHHNPNDIQSGQIKWGEAFRAIADFFNCTQLD